MYIIYIDLHTAIDLLHTCCLFSFCFFIMLWQHGRVKVKTTAQQEEEKRKEREKKLKLYVAVRDACFSKVYYKEVISNLIQYQC